MRILYLAVAALNVGAAYLPTETNQMDVPTLLCVVCAVVMAYMAGSAK